MNERYIFIDFLDFAVPFWPKTTRNDVDFIWWCKTIIDNKEKFINDDV